MSRILAALAELDYEDEELELEHDPEPSEESIRHEELKTQREAHASKSDKASQAVIAQLKALCEQMDGVKAALGELLECQHETAKAVGDVGAHLSKEQPDDTRELDAIAALSASFERLGAVLTAPRELVKDADGKPVGVKIKGT